MVSSDFLWALFWLALLLAGCATAYVMVRRAERGGRVHRDDVPVARWVRRLALVFAVVILAGFAYGLFPYRWEYHSYQKISGSVAAVSPRFMVDGQATSQQFAVRFVDNARVYRCDDTRCALVRPGDRLTVRCIREYQWASTSGYRCRFVYHEPVDRP